MMADRSEVSTLTEATSISGRVSRDAGARSPKYPMTRDIQEITRLLCAIKEGRSDVINGRAVMNEHGYILIEGFRNKRFSWNVAADKLAKLRG